ncbi:hypothetical protein G4B88_006207 [Cannabis sativa]|uniref:Uncharacterized protein n=1 Tax=Cannabis sativa TaxID=3483 RepID=A0A7J6ICL8_CANSA|nr:hypothetical protein G4B88_006207 [Cannabis sativa]
MVSSADLAKAIEPLRTHYEHAKFEALKVEELLRYVHAMAEEGEAVDIGTASFKTSLNPAQLTWPESLKKLFGI